MNGQITQNRVEHMLHPIFMWDIYFSILYFTECIRVKFK